MAFNTLSEFQEDAIPVSSILEKIERSTKVHTQATITILEANTLAQNNAAIE